MLSQLKWFVPLWRSEKIKMVIVVLLTVGSITVKTGYPILLKLIVDMLGGDFQATNVYHLITVFLGFVIVHEVVTRSLPLLRGYLNIRFALSVRNTYYKVFSRNSFKFFHKFRTGDLLTRLTDDIDGHWDRISWYSCSGVLRPFEAILVLLMTLSVMFYYSWSLALFSFVSLPFLVFILAKAEDTMVRYTTEKQKSISNCNDILHAAFSGIRVVKATLSEQDQIAKYDEALLDRVQKEKNFLKINQLIHFFSMLVNYVGKIVVIFVGSYYVVAGDITLGTMLMFMLYMDKLVEPIWTLSWFYASSKQVFKYVERLEETEKSELHNKDRDETIEIAKFDSLKLQNVSFKYSESDRQEPLRNISFTLNKGESLAVVGAIGSGKTTLLELLAGNYEASSGHIYINEKPLRKLSTKKVSDFLGYVRQENLLFSTSIEKNIKLGDDYSDEEIEQSLKTSVLWDDLDQFPDGLETVLNQKGVSISGGQRQRLSIARSLVRKPELLLLDDITAAMDATTEHKFWKNFESYMSDTSCIVVTHRLATAKRADKVLVLDQGKMVEIDSHENLMSDKSSMYRKLMLSL